MVPLLGMLEVHGLALADAEADDYLGLARAAARCRICQDTDACIRWLKWRGRYGRAPACANVPYLEALRLSRSARVVRER